MDSIPTIVKKRVTFCQNHLAFHEYQRVWKCRRKRFSRVSQLIITVLPPLPLCCCSKTSKYLAYNGESNAYVMYTAFATKADEEGYKEVGSLFRAAAKAEAIHRDNHAKVIQTMGGTPKNNIAIPVLKSTAENLEKSIKGESYERDTMYPGFIKEAKQAGKADAVQTFNYALEAETGHAQLYTTAKNNLTSWKQANHPLYVCPVSGYTTLDAKSKNCSQPFEKVS